MASPGTSTTRTSESERPNGVPQHVAIIMDGNGRWARAQGRARIFGHWQGYTTLKQIVYAADDLGIRYLTVYGFSSENWRRPQDEVSGLMELMLTAIQAELEELIENGIRVIVSGRLHELPDNLRTSFEEAMVRTRHNPRLLFNLAINYGGRAEIVDAVREIVREAQSGHVHPDAVTEESIRRHLYHPEVPDPDLLIRTAGEMRLSNFLLWETAYAEIWVTDTPWPEFSRDHLIRAIEEYRGRTRKFGGLTDE